MSDLDLVNSLVMNHLFSIEENKSAVDKWKVKYSAIEGRGLIAVKDILVGDLIYVDYPLIMGPRVVEDSSSVCVVCYNRIENIVVCQKGCSLLVCSENCENTVNHIAECNLLRSWRRLSKNENIDSKKLVRNFLPVRGLLMDKNKKDFLLQLTFHPSTKHGSEVHFLKNHFEISDFEEDFMLRTCRVLDANAYEMVFTTKRNENVNLRGLFPISGLMNHSCTPNVRREFDSNGRMYIRAVKPIPEGDEICTSYTGLLWGTTARRHHLKETKNFLCECLRCADKTEFGTSLGALKCLDRTCSGVILPDNPLDMSSKWCCEICHLEVNSSKIGALQSAIGGFLNSFKLDSPEDLYELVKSKISAILPDCNHIVLELKWKIVGSLMEREECWKKLNTDWLNRVEELCRELLLPYKSLGLQLMFQPARIQLALHRCLLRKLRNVLGTLESSAEMQNIQLLKTEVVSSINEAYEVLKYDIFAPKNLEMRKLLANSDLDKLIEFEDEL